MSPHWQEKFDMWSRTLTLPGKSHRRYSLAVSRYIGWHAKRGDVEPSFDREDVSTFLHETRLAGDDTAAVAIRAFYRFVTGKVTVDHLQRLSAGMKAPRHEETFPSEAEVAGWLDAFADAVFDENVKHYWQHVTNARRSAVAELMYACGITSGELCRLKPADFLRGRPALQVDGRIVPITPTAARAVALYQLLNLANLGVPTTYLFSAHDEPTQPISNIGITIVFSEARLRFGGNASALVLRSAFARHMAKRRFDLRALRGIMGFKHLNSLRRPLGVETSGSSSDEVSPGASPLASR